MALNLENERYGLNFTFLKACLKLLGIIFPRLISRSSGLFIVLLLVACLKEFVAYRVGLIPSQYYNVLPNKDYDGFIWATIFASLFIVTIALVISMIYLISKLVYIVIREQLVNRMQSLYFTSSRFYYVNNLNILDNPDQRITQDVERLANLLSNDILPIFLISPFTVVFYTYKTISTAGWLGPVSAFVFFIIFTVINKCLLGWVSQTVFEQERQEGNFRFKHMQLRINSEAAAFYSCGELEHKKTNAIFRRLLSVQTRLFVKQFVIQFVTSTGDYVGSILTYIAVAMAVFGGVYSNKTSKEITVFISQTSFFLMYLVNNLTKLIDMAKAAGEVIGIAQRITTLIRSMEEVSIYSNPADMFACRDTTTFINSSNTAQKQEREILRLENVKFNVPFTDQIIISQELNLSLCLGQRLLISGPSGCGKSSLLRVLAGLWPLKQGSIKTINRNCRFLYLPQRPYFTNGNLLDQIVFPRQSQYHTTNECVSPSHETLPGYASESTILPVRPGPAVSTELGVLPTDTHSRLCELFEYFRLISVLQREGGLMGLSRSNWTEILSPGEQQRLSLIRLCYHCPDFAFLDECTSQMSHDAEEAAYNRLGDLNISYISVGHRQSLRKYHSQELVFDGFGGFQIQEISANEQTTLL